MPQCNIQQRALHRQNELPTQKINAAACGRHCSDKLSLVDHRSPSTNLGLALGDAPSGKRKAAKSAILLTNTGGHRRMFASQS